MNSNTNIFTLSNGLQVVHQQVKNTQMVHCGIGIKAGTRDENEQNNGVAHFIEHAVFKGTAKRKPYQLFNLIESVGGEINAYTTRENTFFYSSSLKRYFGRNLDLLSDLVFNPIFDPKELEKEKKVVLEEIEMYQDSAEDSIYDDFFLDFYPKHPMGYNILGTPETLKDMGQKEINEFRTTLYSRPNMVLSICGNVSHKRAIDLAEKHFGSYTLNEGQAPRSLPKEVKPFHLRLEKDYFQSHCLIGAKAYNRYNEKRFALMVLNNLLGGSSMNSRLSLYVREKYGYVYNISSSYSAFEDTGIFMVQFGCDDANLDKTINLVHKEFKKLKTKRLGTVQMNSAKRQLQGQLAMVAENPGVVMQSAAKSLLNYGKVSSINYLFEKIDLVNPDAILDVANEVLNTDMMSSIAYLSKK